MPGTHEKIHDIIKYVTFGKIPVTFTLGPNVTATASARRSTPCSINPLASAPNLISLA